MTLKLVLVASLCIAQGFAFELSKGIQEKEASKMQISKSAEEIPHELEEALYEMDKIRETVSVAAMDAYFRGNDSEVIIACFRQQKRNYERLGQQISGMMRRAAGEIAHELKNKYGKYAKRIEGPIRIISMTMKKFPSRMWMYIKNKEFTKAMEVMEESRRIVDENSKILSEVISEMAEDNPEAAKKAEKMAYEILETANKRCEAIAKAFHKCVEEGPRTPIDDYETDMEIESASEE